MRQLVYLILLFFSCVLFAQNLDMKYRPCVGVNCGGYGDPVNFVANDVTSDYGRRDCSDCSTKWHKGIDLSIPGNSSDSDLGYAILAVEDGSISKIRGSKTLKYIHINSDLGPIDDDLGFGYAHIFTSEISNEVSLGAFKLVPMDFPYEDEYAIILPGGLTAIGAYPGTVNGFIQVQTKVDKDNYVAPLGNSGGYPSHLHLHRFIDIAKADNDGSLDGTGGRLNTRDPLEVISFPEPEYEVSIPNIALKYGEEESSIVVRAKMAGESKAEYGRHPRGVMSVDHVKLEIKNEYEDEDAFMLIEGTSLRSEISQGGRSSPITHIYPFGITEPSQTGSESKTGIDANAYSLSSGKGYPYDDYYFSDFNTRKKSRTQELAKVNKDAKYKDGVYNLRGTITTITDKVYPKPENREDRQIIIDNFLPYISEVIIKDGNESGETIYRGVWEWDGFSLTLDSKTLKRAESTDNLWVRIITSESMSQLDAGIGGLSGTPQTNGKNGLDWIFTFPPIASSGDNILWIEGLDKAGNQLNTNPAALPVRNSSSSWSGTYNLGTDQNHVFESGTGCVVQSGGNQVNGAAPQSLMATGCTSDVNGCIYAGILVDQTIVATGERLEFSSVSENSDYTYTWDFGSNASAEATDASGPISVVFHTEGLVEVGLAVCDVNDNCACTTETINVTDNGVDPFSVSFSAPTWSINTYDEVTLFTPVVSGHSGTLSYDWDFGQGVASVDDYSSPTPTVSYRTSGQKTVKLTVTDDFQSVTKTINSFFNVGQIGGGFDVQFSSFSCIPLSLGYYQFSVSLFGDELFKDYTYYWDFGDGQLETTTNRDYINHQYNDFGQYTVSVKVCEDNGPCSGAILTDCINVEPPPASGGQVLVSVKANDSYLYRKSILEDFPEFVVEANRYEPITLTVKPNGGEGEYENYTYKVWVRGGYIEEYDDDFIEYSSGGPKALTVIPHSYAQPGNEEEIDPDTWHWPAVRIEVRDESSSNNYGQPGNQYTEWLPIRVFIDPYNGIEKCYVALGEGVLSDYCYDPSTGYPELSVPIGDVRCAGDVRIRVEQITDGGNVLITNDLQAGNAFDFSWLPVGDRPSDFPYKGNFIAKAYLENDGSSIHAGTREFEINLNGPPNVDAGPNITLCKGASAIIGTEVEGFEYSWSSSPSTNLNLLNSSKIGNPTFTAVNSGTYTYTLTATNLNTGCSNTDQVTVNVSGISAQATTIDVEVGTEQVLDVDVSGGGSDYEYLWTPSTYLDDPSKASPVFSAPDVDESISYSVQISFRDCSTTANVTVNAVNYPPEGLLITSDETPFPILSWYHEGVAQSFEIKRSVNGGSFTTIATVSGDVFEYQDITSCEDQQGTNYCYRIRGIDVDNEGIGISNTECVDYRGLVEDHFDSYDLAQLAEFSINKLYVGAPIIHSPNLDPLVFDYEWSPSTYLDDPNSILPQLTVPNYGTTLNYTVDVSYNGQCTATANVQITFENPAPSNVSVNLNGQFPSVTWSNNGIVKYYVMQRSYDGGLTWHDVGGNSVGDQYTDYQCVAGGVEYCYRVKTFDYNNQPIGVSDHECITTPYYAGIASEFNHSISGTSAQNNTSVFDGFGGQTISSVDNLGNSSLGYIDSRSGSSYSSQIDFRDASFERTGPNVLVAGSYDFWPTSMVESDNYFYTLGAADESGYVSKYLNLFRYSKSSMTSVVRRRLKSSTNAFMSLNSPALIKSLGGDNFIVVANHEGDNPNNTETSILKVNNWSSDTWYYENEIHTNKDVFLSDILIKGNNLYVIHQYYGIVNYLRGYTINASSIDKFRQHQFQFSSNLAHEVHSKLVALNGILYVIGEKGSQIMFKEFEEDLTSRSEYVAIQLSEGGYELRHASVYGQEILMVLQKQESVLVFTYNPTTGISLEKDFDITGLSEIIGATTVNQNIVINYIKNESSGIGEVASVVVGSSVVEPVGTLYLTESQINQNNIRLAENIYVSEPSHTPEIFDVTLESGDELELYASNSIILYDGFTAKAGSQLIAKAFVPMVCDGISGRSASKVGGNVEVLEAEVTDGIENELEGTGKPEVYPNPGRDWINIAYVLEDFMDVRVSFYDIEGKKVSEYDFLNTNFINDRFYVGDFAKGIYIIRIESKLGAKEIKISVK